MKVTIISCGLLVLAACGPTPSSRGAKTAEQLETVKREEQPDRLLERGRSFAALGDHGRAEQYLSAALDRGADPRVVLPLLLRVCIAERRYRVAIQYAEPVLRRRPQDFRLRFVVASLYQSIGDNDVAQQQLELVTQTQPNHAEAHYALAVLARDEKNDPVAADRHFRQYLRIRPDGPHAAEARASLLKVVTPQQPDPAAAPPREQPPEATP
jgi:tetratricopeptide (TPR) repeat protein